MRNLILTFASKNTFNVLSDTFELLGQISYLIGEDEQPHGFIFTHTDGHYGQRKMTISEAIRDVLHEDIQIRIEPIV